ncbi:MAG: DNA polymerase III subunit alpha [Bacteroidia bacterium]|nr:DNA polymerase III subunit alpha [Bacteroidia bacterium]
MLLNCHTYYSFGYGVLPVKKLIREVWDRGYRSFVLSDINNTSAILDTLRMCDNKPMKAIPGIDFRNGIKQRYIGIAKNNLGFKELNEHLSEHLHQKRDFNVRPEHLEKLGNTFLIYPLSAYDGKPLQENEFIGVTCAELTKFHFFKAAHLRNKMIVLHPFSFITKDHLKTHQLLRAIHENELLSKLPKDQHVSEGFEILSKDELYNSFLEYPEIIQNTEMILDSCNVKFEFGKLANKNLKYYTKSKEEDLRLLRDEAIKGLSYRYPEITPEIQERLEKELRIIEKMNFASYFLINWDITSYARSKGYFYVGRGSGANSMVAYLLRITDVDPIDLDLYFERFINENRSNAPDFDIDFSWTDRDDITEYIFQRFGRERTALLATYATYQHDAITRELGKVFGLPPDEINKLQKFKKAEEVEDPIAKEILTFSEKITGFPSHLSIHASGILISEESTTTYTATFMPPKGYPTTQFSMLEAEDIGLFKFDILSQRGLGKIKDAVEIIKKNKNVEIDIHDVARFKVDEEIKKLLSVGKCIGCFYVESPAMRMLLAKLQADDYLRLVAASSIIRPGVSKSGMMNEYIVRYRKKEVRDKAQAELPELYELLKETYGVMVYQEDVIKIAHLFAGLSLADADYLRRGMSWKFKQRNEFHVVKEKFFNNCLAKGHKWETINNIWIQIESFANFAFSKGHSASYAVESYQALYLKAYFPLEYMVATLNNGGGFYQSDLYIHEARMHGASVVAPCINNSTHDSEIKGNTIYLGLGMINQLEKELVKTIVNERELNGPYTDLYQFIKRINVSIEQLRIIIRAGAFHTLYQNKRALLWEAHMMISPVKTKDDPGDLFEIEPQKYTLPELENSWQEDAYDEIELFGFSLCSPFKLLKEPVKNAVLASDLKNNIGKTMEIVGYLVNIKTTWTSSGEKMFFGTFLDQEGHWIDTVHFPPSAKAHPFSGPGVYSIIGRVSEEFDFISIDVSYQRRLSTMNRDDNKPFSRANKDRVYQKG